MAIQKICVLVIFLVSCVIPACISIVFVNSTEISRRKIFAKEIFSKKEVCMDKLGCFSKDDEYFRHLIHRPMNFLPNNRATINTKHLLYTRENSNEPDLLLENDIKTITGSHIKPSSPIKFIVHGFMDSKFYGPWMGKMKNEFLINGDYNVIIVDWSGGNGMPYIQATANSRVVGAELALMIQTLEKHLGFKPEDCHIIGHSLGSHIAGYAGERLKKLGRITGCDPAGPYFQYMPPKVRLDPSDAEFVDVIHTDSASNLLIGLGMKQLVGHADFYPNDGHNQPGCVADRYISFIANGLKEGIRRFVSCNHQRALDFMHNSINHRKVQPVAYQCPSWEMFRQGRCASCGSKTENCAIMGIRGGEYKPFKNDSIQRAFYIKTGGSAPFWLYHYQVAVKLYKPAIAKFTDQKGSFEITLHGENEDMLAHLEKQDLFHGSHLKYLVTTSLGLGEIKSVTLKWFSASLNPLKWIFKPKLFIEYITVVPMNAIEKSPKNTADLIFCDKRNNAISAKQVVSFNRDKNCPKN